MFPVRGGFLALLARCLVGRMDASSSPHWISSTSAEKWKEMAAGPADSAFGQPGGVMKVDPQNVYQTIDGFGGCFNELGWQALLALAGART